MSDISALEMLALRKLELVSKALASSLEGQAGREQEALTSVLTDVLDRHEIAPPSDLRGE